METSNLDGEKNLKPRNIPKELSNTTESNITMESGITWEGKLECKAPNPYFHLFNGTLYLNDNTTILLNAKNLLLRGAVLQNTEWIIGIVVYTGLDTKTMKNSE